MGHFVNSLESFLLSHDSLNLMTQRSILAYCKSADGLFWISRQILQGISLLGRKRATIRISKE